jgi:signal transduction histidine kinase
MMRIRSLLRITAPIMAISLLPLGVGLVTAWNERQSQHQVSDALATNVASMRAAEELAIGLRDVRTQLERFVVSGDRNHLDAVPGIRHQADYWLAEAERTAVTPREQELIARVKDGYGRFFAEFDRVTQPDAGGPPGQVRELIRDALLNDVVEPAQEFLDYNEEQIGGNSADNQRTATHTVRGLLLLAVCGPLSGLLAGFGIARGLSRSLARFTMPVRDAAGKLNTIAGPITVSAHCGLDELEGVLHKIADHVGVVIERLQKSQREVLRAEQLAAVGQLAAGMAHELRNPLTAMKMLVQTAAEGNHAVLVGGRGLAVLEEEITRLERLTQGFLDFARPPRPEKRTFEARRLLRQIVGLVAARAERQAVRVECELPEEPVPLDADVGQIRQVVLNLLLNALEALPAGGTVRLQLATRGARAARGQASRWLRLRVSDTGGGLPAGLGRQVFEPFVSTKETGMGLGLSICKRIVEAHGGKITATNGPQGGAVFTVRLPCAAIPVAALAAGDSADELAPAA